MNFDEAFKALENFIQCNQELFSGVTIENAFGTDRPNIADWSNKDNLGVLVKGDGIGNKSGIYFYEMADGEIIYIGKAGQDNLHERTWDHIATPKTTSSNEQKIYPKNKFKHAEDYYIDAVTNGRVKLRVITVSNSLYVSLLEVYLHTFHSQLHNTNLPVFNKKIG